MKVSYLMIRDILKIVRGMRNGFYYGGKVRLMHSIVIAILFMKGNLWQRIKRILKLTLEHATRTSVFVLVYKTICTILKRQLGYKAPWQSFIAGTLGAIAITIDGETAINQQVTFYILSRMVFGMIKLGQNRGIIPQFEAGKYISIIGWGSVMSLFERNKPCLQPSLQQSMTFLYTSSDEVNNWTELVPFPVPDSVRKSLEAQFPWLKKIQERKEKKQFQSIYEMEEMKNRPEVSP